MDNFEVVINGVNIAAKVLNLDPPEIRFYKDDNITEKGINSMYITNESIVAFDENWIESAAWIDIIIVCFHEVRHHFQYQIVKSLHFSCEFISSDTIGKWKCEFMNYHQPNKTIETSFMYLEQSIEVDAISFSYYMLEKMFQCKVNIPREIKDQVIRYSSKFEKFYENM